MSRWHLRREDVPAKIQELIADDSGVKISPGNDKLNDIPNLSLCPGDTCPGKIRECRYCYAEAAMQRSPWAEVRWNVNTHYAVEDLERFVLDVSAQIHLSRCEYFRIHVGGDFFSQKYLDTWSGIASAFSEVKFLAFTKSFLTYKVDLDWSYVPSNLITIWSVAPSTDFKFVPSGPRAYTMYDDVGIIYPDEQQDRIHDALMCHGKCDTCGICFHMDVNQVDVKFKAHGSWFRKKKEVTEDGVEKV